MALRDPADVVLLVAGVPGAGKSTLLARHAATGAGGHVLDTDPLRERLARRLGRLPYRL
jgi:predicted kinase